MGVCASSDLLAARDLAGRPVDTHTGKVRALYSSLSSIPTSHLCLLPLPIANSATAHPLPLPSRIPRSVQAPESPLSPSRLFGGVVCVGSSSSVVGS